MNSDAADECMLRVVAELESGARDNLACLISFDPDLQFGIVDAAQSEIDLDKELFQP